MEETDLVLLNRFAREQDAEAFSEIVSRYQVFVYTTCRRILGNQADAEDVAQECFLRLARKANTIQASLSGWLHRCATDMSISEARSQAARKNREEEHGKMNSSHTDQPGWAELTPHVDKALNELPDELRLVIIEHFLQRRTQKEIAQELGVSAMTISRRIATATEELRKKLKKAGVVASAVTLAAFLSEQSASAVPASLTASLGKMAVAGTEWSAAAVEASSWVAKGVVPGALTAAAKMKIVAAALAGVIVIGGTIGLAIRGRGRKATRGPVPAASEGINADRRPAVSSEVAIPEAVQPEQEEQRAEVTGAALPNTDDQELVEVILKSEQPGPGSVVKELPFCKALAKLAKAQGLDPEDYLRFRDKSGGGVFSGAYYTKLECGGQTYILVVQRQGPHIKSSSEQVVLLSSERRILDRLQCSINGRYGEAKTELKAAPEDDGAQVVIVFVGRKFGGRQTWWHNWHRITHQGVSRLLEDGEEKEPNIWDQKGLVRAKIENGKFVITFPDMRTSETQEAPANQQGE